MPWPPCSVSGSCRIPPPAPDPDADLFPTQASRLVSAISAGGSIGATAGPVVASVFVKGLGVGGIVLMAPGGFASVIVLVLWLIREKRHLQEAHEETQASRLDHRLRGTL